MQQGHNQKSELSVVTTIFYRLAITVCYCNITNYSFEISGCHPALYRIWVIEYGQWQQGHNQKSELSVVTTIVSAILSL